MPRDSLSKPERDAGRDNHYFSVKIRDGTRRDGILTACPVPSRDRTQDRRKKEEKKFFDNFHFFFDNQGDFVPGRPGIFDPALVLGQRDTRTRKLFFVPKYNSQ